MECDYCGSVFEPRGPGKKQRFCPGGQCKTAYRTEAGREYAKILKRRRAAGGRNRPLSEQGKFELFAKAIKLAQELEAAKREVVLVTKYSGEVLVDVWPETKKLRGGVPWHRAVAMIILREEDGRREFFQPPSRSSFNGFEFQVDGRMLSFDEAAALLAAAARPAAVSARNGEMHFDVAAAGQADRADGADSERTVNGGDLAQAAI